MSVRPIHNPHTMLRAGCLLLCLASATYSKPSEKLNITDFAVPSAVKVGENAELQCRYDVGQPESPLFYVKWWWTPLHGASDKRQQIYQRLAGKPPLSTHHDTITIKDNDTIELLNLQPKDSGTYECEVSDIDEEHKRNAELIVYTEGSGPLLNTSLLPTKPNSDDEPDVLIECEASGVAPEPDLVITVDGQEKRSDEFLGEPVNGVYNISAYARLTRDAVDGREIRCELFFKNEDIPHEVYVVFETYQGSGGATNASETDEPQLSTEAPVATVSMQTDGTAGLSSSWVLLGGVAALARLLALL